MRFVVAPFPGSQILCDLGAEVIKVEDFDSGDYARLYPPLMSDGNSALFHSLNRGKKSVQLDLKSSLDRAAFLRLLSTSDVLIESFRPGVMKKLGIEPTQLAKQFPALIICSISGYGQTGPDALRAGHDINYLAKSGALGVMAEPALLPVQVADIAGGSYPAAIQIIAAIRQKDKTGQGAVIDVSMTDNVYSMLTMSLARYGASHAPFSCGRDLLVGGTPCYGVYRTSDGCLSVGALEPKFWAEFCLAIGRADLIQKQFPDNPHELKAAKEELQAIIRAKSNQQWKHIFDKKDCCVEIGTGREEIRREVGTAAAHPLRSSSDSPASFALLLSFSSFSSRFSRWCRSSPRPP